MAQENPAPALPYQGEGGDRQQSVGLSDQEIIVTARKREERLIDVPVAITAFDNQALQRYSTNSVEILAKQIPQVQITRAGSVTGAQVTIRGIGSNASSDSGIDQSVSFNVDGVPTSRGRSIRQGLFDLEAVQVLKGPQALYFGKNSPAGVIVIDSKGPTDRLEGYARGGYEFKGHEYYGEAAVGGPLTETLGLRVAIRGSNMLRGYVRNVAEPISAADNPIAFDQARGLALPGAAYRWGPESKQIAGRVTLAWKPSSAFDATLKWLETWDRDNGDTSQMAIAHCGAGETQPRTTDASASPPAVVADPFGVCNVGVRAHSGGEWPDLLLGGIPDGFPKSVNYSSLRSHMGSLQMNYHAGDITLTSVTGFYDFKSRANAGGDTTVFVLAGGGGNERSRTWSQELRLQTAFDGPVNVSAGAFYAHEKRTLRTISILGHYLDPATGLSVTSMGLSRMSGKTISAFAELSWDITPELTLSGGARYTNERKDGSVTNLFVNPTAPSFIRALALPQGQVITGKVDENDLSPQAVLTWKPDSNTTLYAAYRTGFKAGAIAAPALISSAFASSGITLDSEKARGYEAGLKFSTLNRRIYGEVSIYHYVFDDLQVQSFDTQVNALISKNAGSAQIDGIEISGSFKASDILTLRGALAYNKARYSSFTNSSCYSGQTVAMGCIGNNQDLTGNPLPRAPDWAGNFGVDLTVPLNNDFDLGITVDGRYTSGYFWLQTNSAFAYNRKYGLLDATIKLTNRERDWELALIGRNLTNHLYFEHGSDRPLGTAGSVRGSLGQPRTIALQATYNF